MKGAAEISSALDCEKFYRIVNICSKISKQKEAGKSDEKSRTARRSETVEGRKVRVA